MLILSNISRHYIIFNLLNNSALSIVNMPYSFTVYFYAFPDSPTGAIHGSLIKH